MAEKKATLIRIIKENYNWLREKAYKRNTAQSKIIDELLTKEREDERRINRDD